MPPKRVCSPPRPRFNNLDIVAPYDGIIAKLDVSAGESVNPGQVVMVIADTSEWYVETTDLTENEIVNIGEDMDVVVVPDALPDLELKGSIESIANVFVEKAGDITYRVRVKLEDVDPRLRWGMTTETRFPEPVKIDKTGSEYIHSLFFLKSRIIVNSEFPARL